MIVASYWVDDIHAKLDKYQYFRYMELQLQNLHSLLSCKGHFYLSKMIGISVAKMCG